MTEGAEDEVSICLNHFHKLLVKDTNSDNNHQNEKNKQKNEKLFRKTYLGVILTETFSDSSCQHEPYLSDYALKNVIRSQIPLKGLFCWPQEYQNLVRFLSIPHDPLNLYVSELELQKISKRWLEAAGEKVSETGKGSKSGHQKKNGHSSIILNVKNLVQKCSKKRRCA